MHRLSDSLRDEFSDEIPAKVWEAVQHYRETGEVIWQEPEGVPAEQAPECGECEDRGRLAIRRPGEPTRYVDCQACGIAVRRRARILAKLPTDFRNATFSGYIMACKTDAARQVAADIGEWTSRGDGSVLLMGPVGAMKTTLASVAWRTRVEDGRAQTAEWITAPDFLEEIRHSYDRDTGIAASQLIDRIRSCDLLVLDDVGAENLTSGNAPWVQEKLYWLINGRANDRLATIFTSNLSRAQLVDRLGEAIVSRMEGMCRPRIWKVDQGVDMRTRRPNGR